MNKSNVTLRGIVVAGDSRQEVEDNYRAVATGLSYKALQDEENNFVFLSNADSELTLLNPLSGDMNLSEASDYDTGSLEFVASDADETVSTFYTLCSEGCESHLIADDPELMKRCPVCACELQDLNEDQINEILSQNSEQEDETSEAGEADAEEEVDESTTSDEGYEEETAIVVAGDSFEEAAEAFRILASGEGESSAFDCETGVVVSSGDIKYSPYTGEAANAVEEAPEFSAEASAEGEFNAHWYVCASDECGKHVIASSESTVFCPVCASGVIEPEEEESAEASAEEEEDETSTASDDHEGQEATAGDDEDDLDDEDYDEDDEDEEDEDEDEEDDEEEDDEDSDFDDDNSMSVSSVTIEDEEDGEATAGSESEEESGDETSEASDEGAEEEETAQASEGEEAEQESTASSSNEDHQVESIQTNLLSLASASGELSSEHLEVACAGEIGGNTTWVAFYNAQPVATASSETTNVSADLFSGPSFRNLVHASAKENGVQAAFDELGFKPIEASVDVESYVQSEVESRAESLSADARDNFENMRKDYASRFEAALATAADGINKNFFRDVKNPVKGALVSALASAGIRNPEKLVAQAFAKHNEQYLKGLVGKTGEIMANDLAVQNQLTEAIAGMSDETAVTASAAPDESLSIGRPVQTAREEVQHTEHQETTASASPKTPDINAVLATLGRRGR